MLEKAGLQVKVLRMKDAKDPDEYLKKFGADRFKLLLEDASNRVEYQINAIRSKYDIALDEQRVEFIRSAPSCLPPFPVRCSGKCMAEGWRRPGESAMTP